jgi:fused signal recognition particle receptor
MVFFWRKKKKEQEADQDQKDQQKELDQQSHDLKKDAQAQPEDKEGAIKVSISGDESVDDLEGVNPVELSEGTQQNEPTTYEKDGVIAAPEAKEAEATLSPEMHEKPKDADPEDMLDDEAAGVLGKDSFSVDEDDTLQPQDHKQDDKEDAGKKKGWFARLSDGLAKSTNKVTQGLSDFVTKRKLDQAALDDLEEALIMADLGPKTAASIVEEFAKTRFEKDVDAEEIRTALAQQVEDILTPVAMPLVPQIKTGEPYVILVTGVNGVGKTTTIGKMARQFQMQGYSVMLAAADTFRAAAVEQLSIWAERNNVPIVKKDVGADPAAVAYEAYDKAKAEGADILMIDTAGRLHNKKNLMDELQKLVRVIRKHDGTAPHSTLLVLDATTGQNAHSQVDAFKELVSISGLIVTKLDGSAKGGVLVSLADQYGLPVHAIGVGETIEDLQPFTAKDFARSLMGVVK